MTQSRSKYQFYQEASLSQKLADKVTIGKDKLKIYTRLAGSNPELSKAIGTLLVLCEKGILDKNDPSISLLLDILDVQRMAEFATSPQTNEISKMGMQMPKAEDIISKFGEDE